MTSLSSFPLSYIALARSRTSQAALKSSSGSASSPSSPSASAASSCAIRLTASAKRSTATSSPPSAVSTTSSASPEKDKMGPLPLAPELEAVIAYVKMRRYPRNVTSVPFLSKASPSSSCCSFPNTEACEIAFSNNAFPYAKYKSALSSASSPYFSVLYQKDAWSAKWIAK